MGDRDAPLDVTPLAEEVKGHILAKDKESKWLDWRSESRLRVRIGDLIPATNQWTTSDRRKRFRKELGELLAPHGWEMTSDNRYEKK